MYLHAHVVHDRNGTDTCSRLPFTAPIGFSWSVSLDLTLALSRSRVFSELLQAGEVSVSQNDRICVHKITFQGLYTHVFVPSELKSHFYM